MADEKTPCGEMLTDANCLVDVAEQTYRLLDDVEHGAAFVALPRETQAEFRRRSHAILVAAVEFRSSLLTALNAPNERL